MHVRLLPFLILLLCGFKSFSQPTVCLSVPAAQRAQDSLLMLPVVRQEANAWRSSSLTYLSRADSIQIADEAHTRALRDSQGRESIQGVLLASSQADTAIWKQRARRRGLLNWLLALGAAAVGYAAIR